MKAYNKPALEINEATPVQIIAESALGINKSGESKLNEDEVLTKEDQGFWEGEW